jgi:hypothetical protein
VLYKKKKKKKKKKEMRYDKKIYIGFHIKYPPILD